MNRINIPNSSYADCPIRMILSRISDKWSILTLFTLTQAPVMRFNELQKTIPDISQKMLTHFSHSAASNRKLHGHEG